MAIVLGVPNFRIFTVNETVMRHMVAAGKLVSQ